MNLRHRHSLIHLLSLLLVLQGLFPVQLHTQLVRDEQGQLVQVCTINGIQSLPLDHFADFVDEEQIEENQHTAAIALSDLMAAASPATFNLEYPESDRITPEIPRVIESVQSLTPDGLRPIRAPPLA